MMEIRGDLSYWLRRIEQAARAKRANDPLGRQPEWLLLSGRNLAEIKHLLDVNGVLKYQCDPRPTEPSQFCGLKIAVPEIWKQDSDFLEVV